MWLVFAGESNPKPGFLRWWKLCLKPFVVGACLIMSRRASNFSGTRQVQGCPFFRPIHSIGSQNLIGLEFSLAQSAFDPEAGDHLLFLGSEGPLSGTGVSAEVRIWLALQFEDSFSQLSPNPTPRVQPPLKERQAPNLDDDNPER